MADHLTPAHPAANVAFDEQGRALSLHLSEAEIRLECVRIVVAHPQCFTGHAIGAAKDVASFVMTGELPLAEEGKKSGAEQSSEVDMAPFSFMIDAREHDPVAALNRLLAALRDARLLSVADAVSAVAAPINLGDYTVLGEWNGIGGPGLILGKATSKAGVPEEERAGAQKPKETSADLVREGFRSAVQQAMSGLQDAKAKEPERPALSEAARSALRSELRTARHALKDIESRLALHVEHAADAEKQRQQCEKTAQRFRVTIAALQCDLGEPAAP